MASTRPVSPHPNRTRLVFATYDVTMGARWAISTAFLARWTRAAARLTADRNFSRVPAGPFAPPPDTGEVLGLPPSQPTLTFGFGPTCSIPFGLAHRRPAALVDLPAFPR